MTEAADTQLLLDVAAASAEEDTGWPSPPSCDTSLRDPELASVEQAWRTGQLAVAF